MFFAKIAAVATLALSVFAAPVSTPSANPADVLNVMNGLKDKISPALETLKGLAANGVEGITAEAVKPALDTVTSSVDEATKALYGLNLPVGVPELKRDGAVGEVASVAAGILGEVFTTLNGLKGVPVVGDLVPAVESSLSGLIGGLNSVLAGVLALLAPLLAPVLNISNGLGLGGLLGGLGL